jgi:uncharacterized protein YraI
MRKQLVGIALASAAGWALAPAGAYAQSQAVTNAPVYIYAGPAPDYPVVSQLPGNAPVTVMGCVAGYSWCDVIVPGMRGWVYGGSLYYPYQGATVPALNYGATLGLPIIGFALGSYWDSYYRGQPWYHDRSRWIHHAPPRAVPPPHYVPPHGRPPVHGVPPHGRPPVHGVGPRPLPGHVGGPGHPVGRPPSGGPGHIGGRPPGGAPGHPGGRPPAGPAARPGGGHGGGPGGAHGGPRPGGGGPRGGGGQHGGGGNHDHH